MKKKKRLVKKMGISEEIIRQENQLKEKSNDFLNLLCYTVAQCWQEKRIKRKRNESQRSVKVTCAYFSADLRW